MRAALASLLVTASLASAAPLPGLPELKAAADQLVPTPVSVDLTGMPASERKALARLVQAARILDPLFVRQSWAGSEAWMTKLARDTTPLAQARLRLFLLNQGPWDRLAKDAPPARRPGEAGLGKLLSGGREQGGRVALAVDALARGACAGDRLLHRHPASPGRGIHRRALQPRVPG